MPPRYSRESGSSDRITRPRKGGTTCKTCSSCRQKKIKCSSSRPRCDECVASNVECIYPRDARREPRPSRQRFEHLEAAMTAMFEHMKASGVPTSGLAAPLQWGDAESNEDMEEVEMQGEDTNLQGGSPQSINSAPLPTPTASSTAHYEFSGAPNTSSIEAVPAHSSSHGVFSHPGDHADSLHTTLDHPAGNGLHLRPQSGGTGHYSQQDGVQPNPKAVDSSLKPAGEVADELPSGLSPCEARVAGVFHQDGCVSSVHGLSGIINPTRRSLHKANISKVSKKGEAAISSSKARLISNAVLQKQRENRIFRQPQQTVDLDGCEPELAKHLIDLHFNRHYCSYLITYRPAVLDSIATGGPWVNKLLLNAIYYNSALYSDRPGLRDPSNDLEVVGERFYRRFSQLLIEAMGTPSVPSAIALLLTSATLVAQGKVSAGWALSGTAYRMIIDLGCHMMLSPDYQDIGTQSSAQMLQTDIEHEMRKRLYWGAYITDVTQSLYLGRQPSFANTVARVPLKLLDTFGELDEWEPYVDPTVNSDLKVPAYVPQPAYAISSFHYLVKLMQTGALVSELYCISTVSCTPEVIMQRKTTIESQLNSWATSLPAHLVFEPGSHDHSVPPPHLITLHTTFHTLRILLYRAFMEEGHLRRYSDNQEKLSSEEECINSALNIKRHVQAYRDTFTLRRAPFLLSYAIYSAVAVILPQERHDRGSFSSIIAFFWNCLSELQHGCNFGLKKPLSVLRTMAREFQISAKEQGVTGFPSQNESQASYLDENFFPQLPLGLENLEGSVYSGAQYTQQSPEHRMADPLGSDMDTFSPSLMNFLNDQEWNISQNTLYGLFAPP